MRDGICWDCHPNAVAEEATERLLVQTLLGNFLLSLDLTYVYSSFGHQFKLFPPGSLR